MYISFANEYVNTMTQKPFEKDLLPIAEITNQESNDKKEIWDYIYEPSSKEILDGLLKRYIETQIFQAVIENNACEQAAKMIAMKNASENAEEIIKGLQLVYNKRETSFNNTRTFRNCRWSCSNINIGDNMSDVGVIKQIIGAVIDVEFDKENIPNIYDALVVEEKQSHAC